MKLNLSAVLAAVLLAATSSPLDAAIYTIDSASSTNTFGFQFGEDMLTETSAGSSVSSLSGTIDATVTLGGGALVFNESGGIGTSNLIFDAGEAAQYLPASGGALAAGNDDIFADGSYDPAGNGDGQFTAGVTHASLTHLNAAFLSISNHTMSLRGSGTTGGANTGITTDLLGYISIDSIGVGIPNAERRIIDNSLVNRTADTIGYSLVGNVETLTIPYNVQVSGGTGNLLFYSGTVVASRTITAIPEPTSSVLLACMAIGACVTVRRRRR